MTKTTARTSEVVTNGHITIGMVVSTERGHEAYAAAGEYLATYPTLSAARKAVFNSQQESSANAAS